MNDKKIEKLILKEEQRQLNHVELIASENFVSKDVLEATGSVFTNKYAEGYPNNRYYGGCENVNELEQLAIDRVKKIIQRHKNALFKINWAHYIKREDIGFPNKY